MRSYYLAVAVWLAASGTAGAQTLAPVHPPRADIEGAVGWHNLHEPTSVSGNDWLNAIVAGNVGVSVYWTEHLRTHLDFTISTEGRQYRGEVLVVNGRQTFSSSRLLIGPRSLAVGQQYQFFHNAWFHPHAGGGALFLFDRRTEEFNDVIDYDPATSVAKVLRPARTDGPTTRTGVRPFADVGFKAYLSRRAYFVQDTRLVVSSRTFDQVLFTFGFGVDF